MPRPKAPRLAFLLLALSAACPTACSDEPPALTLGAGGEDGGAGGGAGGGSPSSSSGAPSCVSVEAEPVVVGVASEAGEAVLELPARAESETSFAEAGSEAILLEISGKRGLIGHVLLHQGRDAFDYEMLLGELEAGEEISARVSDLSAEKAEPRACVGPGRVRPASDYPEAEGIRNAPVFKWPVQKRFDDVPLVLGWSEKKKKYEAVFTNENGGTPVLCGGGAEGLASEIERWGRASDIEGVYEYGHADPTWKRCTGKAAFSEHAPTMEGLHPVLYYGDGHNGLFESRGGYGKTCGTKNDRKADGDLEGWNVESPGSEPSEDAPFVVVFRPKPVSLDDLGYAERSGRREALPDRYAPWLFRLTADEIAREGKVDMSHTYPLEQYVYLDVRASNVGGKGDASCSLDVDGGFRVRVRSSDGELHDGPQMTADFFGGDGNWKRIAVPLSANYPAGDFEAIVFDAYDGDGIYWLELGDVFVPRPEGDGGASLDYLHQASSPVDVYVDDDKNSCPGDVNSDGPDPKPYPCVGSEHVFEL